ncbi:DUF1289 domain-containing protein [Litorilituus lipolyticus]|uniref:DUF1289 domain-containing protein n=1 Tax=Litorilituus lipolyticus TaxID=2491017 RepID=A0A502L3K1_9GAMM|nr:DUF1289 domain-containing protein [Litorilituus lipolyticus]TPH18528.1 DUF1289 domain-containing protein [Litorilituus lipolyticus]
MQLDFFDIPSPCVGICQSDEKGYCLGCMRTRDERQGWGSFDNDDKQKVIKRCIQRRKRKLGQGKSKTVEQQSNEIDLQPSLLDPPEKTQTSKDSDLDFSEFEL